VINVYDIVKSFDFDPGRDPDCFVSGVVVAILKSGEPFPFSISGAGEHTAVFEDCDRYVIRVTNKVFAGKEVESRPPFVFPPVNGTPKLFGGICNGVVRA